MKLKSDVLINVAIGFACVAIGVNATLQVVERLRANDSSAESRSRRGPVTGYRQGDTLPTVTGLDFTKSRQTVILLVSSSCRFCTESMPFYGKLVDAVGRKSSEQIRLVAASTESPEQLRTYFDRHAVPPMTAFAVRPDQFKISGTPTVLLVDSQGRVQSTWLGRLPKAEEDAILAAVEKAT
jgi:hypothetical protein